MNMKTAQENQRQSNFWQRESIFKGLNHLEYSRNGKASVQELLTVRKQLAVSKAVIAQG